MVNVRVRPDPNGTTGRVTWGGRTVPCSLGRAGVRADKREGDGATPAGRFAVRSVLYRPDRLARPRTGLPVAALSPVDGWCDDPGSPAYNRRVVLPFAAGHEALWRADGLYDLIVVIGHNDDPPVPGRGSAVFVHCRRVDGGPTAGCVALAPSDLLDLLAVMTPASRIAIAGGAPPAQRRPVGD